MILTGDHRTTDVNWRQVGLKEVAPTANDVGSVWMGEEPWKVVHRRLVLRLR